jgi:hypothetical protein
MHHLIGAALKVFATIGVVVTVAEFFQEKEKLERRRLSDKEEYERRRLEDKEHKKRLMISEKESKLHKNIVREIAIKRQAEREAEINQILYGIQVELPAPILKQPWWRFGKSKKIEYTPKKTEPTYFDDEAALKAQEEFHAKNPFICIKVPSRYMVEFVQEFSWLQTKIGHVPDEKDQKAILVGIIKNS